MTYDANPQASVEMLSCAEKIVVCEELCSQNFGKIDGNIVKLRRLPTVGLGRQRYAVMDKVSAHIHQIFLDCGKIRKAVHQSFLPVRQGLTDMGTEAAIANHPNIIDE